LNQIKKEDPKKVSVSIAEPSAEPEHEPQRTSTFVHFSKLSDTTIASIENRTAELLSLPNHSIEPLQLVRYSQGQYFRDHHDIGVLYEDGSVELPEKNAMTPPRRIVTILVYLNDLPDDGGGGTVFPLLHSVEKDSDGSFISREGRNGDTSDSTSTTGLGLESNRRTDESRDILKDKDEGHPLLSIRPKKGMAVLWCNVTSDGNPDPRVVHRGEIITTRETIKYAMNIWACEE
jgi:hypothetical protein